MAIAAIEKFASYIEDKLLKNCTKLHSRENKQWCIGNFTVGEEAQEFNVTKAQYTLDYIKATIAQCKLIYGTLDNDLDNNAIYYYWNFLTLQTRKAEVAIDFYRYGPSNSYWHKVYIFLIASILIAIYVYCRISSMTKHAETGLEKPTQEELEMLYGEHSDRSDGED